jgi:hypothetical protein
MIEEELENYILVDGIKVRCVIYDYVSPPPSDFSKKIENMKIGDTVTITKPLIEKK